MTYTGRAEKYEKPALTFEQQADLLISRGMLGDRAQMIARLSRVNYYRLSAYWYTFRIKGTENLQPGTTFEQVWDRYVFDQRLRVLAMEAIEHIEVATRTQLAYHHAHAHGPTGYTQRASLPQMRWRPAERGRPAQRGHEDWIADVRAQIEKGREHPFMRHFATKYALSSDPPLWMTTELMTLRSVLSLYQGCDDRHRRPVASYFGVLISEFESWLLMLVDVRNICAHHGRFWNRKLVKIPKLPATAEWSSPVRIDPTTVFAALTICAHCVHRLAPESDWCSRVRDLMSQYAEIPKRHPIAGWSMGVPDNWVDCPIWKRAR